MASIIGGLALRERKPGRLVLTLPVGHRVIFGLLTALAVFILCFGVLFEGEPTILSPHNTVAGILVLAMAFGLVYEDRWTFDRARGRVEIRFGTLFLARRTCFPMVDLERICIERFTRGRLVDEETPAAGAAQPGAVPFAEGLRPRRRWTQPRYVRLVAVDRMGKVRVLDMGSAHGYEQFRNRGLRIAGFCGVRFEDATV
jgi:hypothetical protein